MTTRLQRLIQRRVRGLGIPGILGLVLWGFAAAFYFSVLVPAQVRLDTARSAAAALQQRMAHAGSVVAGREIEVSDQLAEFYRLFPDEKSAPDWIGKIVESAQRSGLSLDQGEYQPVGETSGRLTRLQMTLPLRGEYARIRQFLALTRANVPVVALEQIQFERQKIGDPLVDAKIRLVLYLERES